MTHTTEGGEVQRIDLDEYNPVQTNYYGTVELRQGSIDLNWQSYPVDPKYLADAAELMQDSDSFDWVPVVAALEAKEKGAEETAKETLVFVNGEKTKLVVIAPRTPTDWEVIEHD